MLKGKTFVILIDDNVDIISHSRNQGPNISNKLAFNQTGNGVRKTIFRVKISQILQSTHFKPALKTNTNVNFFKIFFNFGLPKTTVQYIIDIFVITYKDLE